MLPAGPDEPASVVAARQLAEEARLRRPGRRPRPDRRVLPARALPEDAGEPDLSTPAR